MRIRVGWYNTRSMTFSAVHVCDADLDAALCGQAIGNANARVVWQPPADWPKDICAYCSGWERTP